MDHQIISLIIAFFVFLATPFLFPYVRKTKGSSRGPWKSYALCCFVYGTAFAAGFLLAATVESTSDTLAQAFGFERETSAITAKIAVNLIAAALASLSAFYVVRTIVEPSRTAR